LVTPSRISQIAGAEQVGHLDARALDGLLYTLSPPRQIDMTPRELSFVFAKHKVDGLSARELISLQKDC
jgi:hypothetical protein